MVAQPQKEGQHLALFFSLRTHTIGCHADIGAGKPVSVIRLRPHNNADSILEGVI